MINFRQANGYFLNNTSRVVKRKCVNTPLSIGSNKEFTLKIREFVTVIVYCLGRCNNFIVNSSRYYGRFIILRGELTAVL